MRRLCFLFMISLVLAAATETFAAAKYVTIHGYVTNLVSPTSFEIEDYKITSAQSLVLDFDKGDTEGPIDFRPENIRVGTELEIKGEYNESTGELKANAIKVFLDEYKKIKRTALMERVPKLDKTETGWTGTFFADGQRIVVVNSTKVIFRPNQSETKALKEREKTERKQIDSHTANKEAGESEDDRYVRPLESLDEIGPNTFMKYEGVRQPDGSIEATSVEFMRNELEPGEARLWKQLEPKIKQPDYAAFKPGELKIAEVGNFKLFPNQEVQDYVRRVGERLIPEYRRELPAGDPNKIPFRFFVVDVKNPNAFALANGVVVLHSSMFVVLQNEAQLAAVLGHEIAHSVQEHTRLQQQYHKKALFAMNLGAAFAAGMGYGGIRDIVTLLNAAIKNGYQRSLENQADRIGLEYMVEAGYDPREAPFIWKEMAQKFGDAPTNLFWSDHDNDTTRRSYLMAELKNNYADADFAGLKRDSDDYKRIAQLVEGSRAKKGTLKIVYNSDVVRPVPTPAASMVEAPPPSMAEPANAVIEPRTRVTTTQPSQAEPPQLSLPTDSGSSQSADQLVAVTFKSTPDGASITIDGKFLGTTPSTISLIPGDHEVMIRKAGSTDAKIPGGEIKLPAFRTWKRTLTVSPGSTTLTVEATLEPMR